MDPFSTEIMLVRARVRSSVVHQSYIEKMTTSLLLPWGPPTPQKTSKSGLYIRVVKEARFRTPFLGELDPWILQDRAGRLVRGPIFWMVWTQVLSWNNGLKLRELFSSFFITVGVLQFKTTTCPP